MPDTPRPSKVRRFWIPATAAGAGGTAAALWFEEILLFAETILALLLLPVMAGLIYLFNILLFKTNRPNRDDLQSPGKRD